MKSQEGQSEQLSTLAGTSTAGDDADIASDTIDRALLNSLGEANQRRLTAIDNALDRIRQGTYGICLMCKRPIPAARLEALPSATLCVSCQAKLERRV